MRTKYLVYVMVFMLLSAISFSGCSGTWRWVRRGTKVDSLEMKVNRLDSLNKAQNQYLTEMNADLLTEMENIRQDISQLSAQLQDNQQGLSRIYQKFGTTQSDTTHGDTNLINRETPADPDELYNTAYLDYTRGNYDVAIEGFQRYLKYFPQTELSDNAQYWVGECYYSKKMYPDAILEFEKVAATYPEGNKVVSSYYKIGLAYESLSENKKAKDYYKKVFDNYPNTPEAKLARDRYNSLP